MGVGETGEEQTPRKKNVIFMEQKTGWRCREVLGVQRQERLTWGSFSCGRVGQECRAAGWSDRSPQGLLRLRLGKP